MRRLFASSFNGAAVVSAVLFVAAVVIWVRSYRTSKPDTVQLPWKNQLWAVRSIHGRIILSNDPEREWAERRKTEEINAWLIHSGLAGRIGQGYRAEAYKSLDEQEEEFDERRDLLIQADTAIRAARSIIVPARIEHSLFLVLGEVVDVGGQDLARAG